jgi:hypothetical protein
METKRKGDTVRINEDSRVIIKRINEITNISKGTILFDSLRILEDKLVQNDYNYSKIIKEYPVRK